MANDEVGGVVPDGAGTGNGDRIITGTGNITADVAGGVLHAAAVGDRQRVAEAVVTNVKIGVVRPDRAVTGDGRDVKITSWVVTDVAGVDIGQHAAAGDGERVVGAGVADVVFDVSVIVVCPVNGGGRVVGGRAAAGRAGEGEAQGGEHHAQRPRDGIRQSLLIRITHMLIVHSMAGCGTDWREVSQRFAGADTAREKS